ncbi:MAG: glycosyl transferase, partial [Anaerolineae bacterium]|nr:glycosyl transferase [Anaerolineae bacterium]
ADTYPDQHGLQHLALVNVANGEWVEIGTFKHQDEHAKGDIRCDLHPRWSEDSRYLTVDSIHTGPRKIYMLDVKSHPLF